MIRKFGLRAGPAADHAAAAPPAPSRRNSLLLTGISFSRVRSYTEIKQKPNTSMAPKMLFCWWAQASQGGSMFQELKIASVLLALSLAFCGFAYAGPKDKYHGGAV